MKLSDFSLDGLESVDVRSLQLVKDFDFSKSIVALFDKQVEDTPEAIACKSGDGELSYCELNKRVCQLANLLIEKGVAADKRVGLYLTRSEHLLVSYLAVLKAGGCYVPLDPEYPANYVKQILIDANPVLLVTDSDLLGNVGNLNTPVVLIGNEELSCASVLSRKVVIHPEQLACVMYTSGSTGLPKGVMVPHRQLLNCLHALWEREPFVGEELVAQKTSISFAISTKEIFAGLLKGVPQLFVEDSVVKDIPVFVKMMESHGVSRLYTFPSQLEAILDYLESSPSQLSSIKYLFVSIEPLSDELFERIQQVMPKAKVWYIYGCTEMNDMTYCDPLDAKGSSGFVPVGYPIANSDVYVLDEGLRVSPVGILGEVYVSSVGIARGYFQRPGLTAERFIPNIYGQPGTCMYKTGDMARYLEGGALEFIGRRDYEIKIRGYRVDVRQVEKVIAAMDGIKEVAVIGWPQDSKTPQLVVYIVLDIAVDGVDQECLREYLGAKLPTYMVPTLYEFLQELPRLPNSKIDRQSLPAPTVHNEDADFVAPSTKTETILADIWAQVLVQEGKTPKVGKTDNFFALGGHSLLATQLFSRIRQELNVDLPISTLFEMPELETFSVAVDKALLESGIVADKGVGNIARNKQIPLSYEQERLWFIHENMEEQRTSYNLVFAFHLHGDLSIEAMRKAVNMLVDRHEILRTTFSLSPFDGEPQQVVADLLTLDVPVLEVKEEDVPGIIEKQAAFVFDLSKGPLFQVSILKAADGHHALLINMHHIISDGWSLNLIVRDLHALYTAALSEIDAVLPALPLQYADFSQWQREQDLSEHLIYWKEQLADYDDGLALPYDYPRPADKAWSAGSFHYEYPKELAVKVARQSQERNTTLYMTLLASFAIVINQYSGREDLCLGTTIAGREQLEFENLIGFFVNILAMRLDLSGNPTVDHLLRDTRQLVLEAYEHASLPFEHLLSALNKERDSSLIPLVPVMLRHQNFPTAEIDNLRGDVSMQPASVGERTTPSELDLQFYGDGEYLQVTVEYAKELFSESTVQALIAQHQNVLEFLVENQGCRLRDIPTLVSGDAEKLKGVNQTDVDINLHQSIADIFECQVKETPYAVACISVDEFDPRLNYASERTLTYSLLNERANQLAALLKQKGCGVAGRVAIHCERSLEFLASMLAVFKVGGCYIPIDPAYSEAVISDMLGDVEPDFVLTSGKSGKLERWETLSVALNPTLGWENTDLASMSEANSSIKVAPNQTACIMYTSGSTGKPKGVMVPYSQILNWLEASWKRAPLAEGDVILQKTSSAFAVSVKEMLTGLMAGNRQVILPDAVVKDAKALMLAIEHWRVSHIYLVPSHLQALVDVLSQDKESSWGSVKQITTAGEPLSAGLVESVRDCLPSVTIWNNYGCTELNDTTYSLVSSDQQQQPLSIGTPIANTKIYVLDKHLRQVPRGAVGKLYVDSIGMAQGYWQQQKITAERFIPNPYSATPGSRMYKTGDLVRQLEDGSLEYIGRDDFEVKVRGYRIDVRQVEAAAMEHSSVQQICVVGWPLGANAPQLAAYIVVKNGGGLTVQNVRDLLNESLPAYMVPTLFTFVDALPKLPNGKLDRLSLPEPKMSGDSDQYVSPRNETELRLVEIFIMLLNVEKVGVNDNFFALGGDSLLTIRLARAIYEMFQIDIPSSVVFNSKTLADIALYLNASDGIEYKPTVLVPLKVNSGKPNVFCIHPIGGKVFYYKDLSDVLGEAFNICGITSLENMTYSSIRELAEFYADELVKYQSDDAFNLVGWSSGGLFALEIASVLEERGKNVAYLGLLDSSLIPHYSTQEDHNAFLAVLNILATLRRQGFAPSEVNKIVEFIKAKGWDEGVFAASEKETALKALTEHLNIKIELDSFGYILEQLEVTREYLSLLVGYTPKKKGGQVYYYKASEEQEEAELLNALSLESENKRVIGGGHYSILEGENAVELGRRILEDIV
ncbi:amino acid adenylation domain-containing protein [Endozoicomonas sp. SM1973]|uniref:Amino acid adenylation domain-containing protein n=1 Tax=Spartinivicinus marinus TaxID=2994442 RepID=A0A853IFT9_9GAMM|nr:non-ribosomal peptide synthetase [Spartinivicinus marinus]MCX4030254.1 non-ribosomal peptide synthetase [Spartinivicinus marinus]NYZ69408.1 amino acid adenylation domain-containing protein [Spartinivicinus marinus]